MVQLKTLKLGTPRALADLAGSDEYATVMPDHIGGILHTRGRRPLVPPAWFSNQRHVNQEMKMQSASESMTRSGKKGIGKGKEKASGGLALKQARASTKVDASSCDNDWPREQMIAEAAYFLAEQRGFAPGNEMSDWLQAEATVEGLLRDGGQ